MLEKWRAFRAVFIVVCMLVEKRRAFRAVDDGKFTMRKIWRALLHVFMVKR